MSDMPPLPVIGQDPWGDDLNAYLTALEARVSTLEATPSARTLTYFALVSQTAPPPSSTGQMRTDNATTSASTHLWVSTTTDDGTTVANLLNLVTVGQVLYLQARTDDSRWARFTVSANTPQSGYVDFTVTPLSNSGLEISKANVKVVLVLPQ